MEQPAMARAPCSPDAAGPGPKPRPTPGGCDKRTHPTGTSHSLTPQHEWDRPAVAGAQRHAETTLKDAHRQPPEPSQSKPPQDAHNGCNPGALAASSWEWAGCREATPVHKGETDTVRPPRDSPATPQKAKQLSQDWPPTPADLREHRQDPGTWAQESGAVAPLGWRGRGRWLRVS